MKLKPQMKRPARPLFSFLLLAAFAAALTCRAFLRRGGFDFDAFRLPSPAPVFNSTILSLAGIDLGDAKFKQDTEKLLDPNFQGQPWRQRNFAAVRRVTHHADGSTTVTTRPLLIRSPKLFQHFPDFRRNLQDWVRRKLFQADIMSDLVRLVKRPIDRHYGLPASDKKYSSCAVVGNSGILLNNNYGKLIDSHEAVIRLNNARISTFEAFVGWKTTMSFVNSNILHLCARRQGCFCHPYGPGVPMLMYICQAVHLLDYTVCNSTHKSPLLVTDPRFDVLCSRITKYYSLNRFVSVTGKPIEEWDKVHDGRNFHYSSGMQAIMLALGICDKVSVFGYGKSDSAKHHYHTNQKGELQLHDYEAEYELYRDIIERPRAIPFVSDKFKFPPMEIYH